MAQDFVGSGNNVPLLEAIGQFGTRLTGGDDSASPRYIHTRLTVLATLLFPKEDDAVLDHLDDDGISVEPRFYLPVLPLVLLNGAAGIGTGYSTNVPSYDPRVVASAVRSHISGTEAQKQAGEGLLDVPWYRGFKGAIEESAAGRLRSRGIIARIPGAPTKLRVTELPLGLWTEDFKTLLEALIDKNSDVRSFSNESSDAEVDFTITFSGAAAVDAWLAPPPAVSDATVSRLEVELKMLGAKGLSTTNMHLFNSRGQIQKYATPAEVVAEFCAVRIDGYVRRRAHIIERVRLEADVLRNRALFLELVGDGRLRLQATPDDRLAAEMEAAGLERMAPTSGGAVKRGGSGGMAAAPGAEEDAVVPAEGDGEARAASYAYLLSMPMSSMTQKRKEQLDELFKGKLTELAESESATPEGMWEHDLDAFVRAYDQYLIDMAA